MDPLNDHPLEEDEIVDTVLRSWDDIFNSKIGSFYIGREITPTPQIMSFFLHELVPQYLSQAHAGVYRTGQAKNEKDIHHIQKPELSIEIKASSHPDRIFGNRSYAQPSTSKEEKSKDGYYITVNFEKFSEVEGLPEVRMIRFGYLKHTDWIAQESSTGQKAELTNEAYRNKLKVLYI